MQSLHCFIGFLLLAVVCISGRQVNIVQTCSTNGDRWAKKPSVPFSKTSSHHANTLKVENDAMHNAHPIIGWGAAFTEATTTILNTLEEPLRNKVMADLFDPVTGLGYNMVRVPIGSCDYSEGLYNYDNVTNDFNMTHFSIQRDLPTKVRALKQAAAIAEQHNTKLLVFAAPWSPPGWMKKNKKMGGSAPGCYLNSTTIYQAMADYVSTFITNYKQNGVDIWAISPQNEPGACHSNAGDTWFPACCFDPDFEIELIEKYLVPRFDQDGHKVQMMFWDHNKDDIVTWSSALAKSSSSARSVVDIVAYHWYAGQYFYHLNESTALLPEKTFLATENCIGLNQGWNGAEVYAADMIGDLQQGGSGYVEWNAVLDSHYWHDGCSATIMCDAFRHNQSCTPNAQYWYAGHFAKFIPPGSVQADHQFTVRKGLEGTIPHLSYTWSGTWVDGRIQLCNGGTPQHWGMKKLAGGFVALQVAGRSVPICLQVNPDGISTAGYKCSEGANQQWKIDCAHKKSCVVKNGAHCLKAYGSYAIMGECDSAAKWEVEGATLKLANTNTCLDAGGDMAHAVVFNTPAGNGKVVAVVENTSDDKLSFELQYGGEYADLAVPAHCITTFEWQN
eukprot:TRINITY_DN27346_c0_g1_i1.p1 TRINITY_DN27346_c0_g1~~TRINITY_DN27346_c0_g1_i1.p1  ORF type:complete len:616 (+),score=74.09 TRINITY_DN27346_c0_g1_i1:27-1874(+)